MREQPPTPLNHTLRAKHLLRVAFATMLVFAMAVYVGSAVAVDSRVDRRAAEMPLPDPYLDPTWPEEEPVEGLGDRYEAGDTDNVEEVPFDDEIEFQADQRALQELTGDVPLAPEAAGAAVPAPPAAPVNESDEILPEDDHRDPVEW
jgi:hypothetical protein